MAQTGERKDPFPAFRFEVKLDDLAVGGFSECAGLQIETEVQDYVEGGLNTHVLKFPTRTKQTNITLKRGIVDRVFWDWYYELTQGQVRFRNGSIIVRDPSGGQVTMEWQFSQAFPCKWVGPDLNAMQSNVAVETMELCHRGLERRQ
ncbi:MAG: phage tail protein [Desulfobacterales bacterium]|jgi:phage tail-like protein